MGFPSQDGRREHAAFGDTGYGAGGAGQFAAEAVRQRPGDEHGNHRAQKIAAVGIEVDHAVAPGAARQLACVLAGASVHQHGAHQTLELPAALGADAGRDLEYARVPPGLDVVRHLVAHIGGGRAGAPGVAEGEDIVVPDALDDVDRPLEVLVRLAGKPHDEIGRERDAGHRLRELVDELQVARYGVAAIHALEHAIGA
jgi:hypothetical protein